MQLKVVVRLKDAFVKAAEKGDFSAPELNPLEESAQRLSGKWEQDGGLKSVFTLAVDDSETGWKVVDEIRKTPAVWMASLNTATEDMCFIY